LVVSDGGRGVAESQVEPLLMPDTRVILVDLFYFGECKIHERDYLFALLIATVGDRALGIQASQLAALSRWAGESGPPVTLATFGPRSAIIGLVAANLDSDRIVRLDMRDVKWKLSDVIGNNQSFEQAPELFCFGLLKEFDSDQLLQLAGPEKSRSD